MAVEGWRSRDGGRGMVAELDITRSALAGFSFESEGVEPEPVGQGAYDSKVYFVLK
jgi:hypothetical protein